MSRCLISCPALIKSKLSPAVNTTDKNMIFISSRHKLVQLFKCLYSSCSIYNLSAYIFHQFFVQMQRLLRSQLLLQHSNFQVSIINSISGCWLITSSNPAPRSWATFCARFPVISSTVLLGNRISPLNVLPWLHQLACHLDNYPKEQLGQFCIHLVLGLLYKKVFQLL